MQVRSTSMVNKLELSRVALAILSRKDSSTINFLRAFRNTGTFLIGTTKPLLASWKQRSANRPHQ